MHLAAWRHGTACATATREDHDIMASPGIGQGGTEPEQVETPRPGPRAGTPQFSGPRGLRSFSRMTWLPSALYSTRDMKALMSITPRPQSPCIRSAQVGSGTAWGSKPLPSSVISTRTRSRETRQRPARACRSRERLPWQMALTRASSTARWTLKTSCCCQCWASSCAEQFLQHLPAGDGIAGDDVIASPDPLLGHGSSRRRSSQRLKGVGWAMAPCGDGRKPQGLTHFTPDF